MIPLDYSRCANADCPIKHKCARTEIPKNDTFSITKFIYENGKCNNFIRIL